MIRALYWTTWGLSFLPRMLLRRHGWRMEGVGRVLAKVGRLGLAPMPHVPVFELMPRTPGFMAARSPALQKVVDSNPSAAAYAQTMEARGLGGTAYEALVLEGLADAAGVALGATPSRASLLAEQDRQLHAWLLRQAAEQGRGADASGLPASMLRAFTNPNPFPIPRRIRDL